MGGGAAPNPGRRRKSRVVSSLHGLALTLNAVHTFDPVSRERICVSCTAPSTRAKHGMSRANEHGRLMSLMTGVQDQAHLPNERISLSNLRRGKRVVERFLSKVASISQ